MSHDCFGREPCGERGCRRCNTCGYYDDDDDDDTPTPTPTPEEQTMYTTRNFKTKAALKLAVANGLRVTVYNPGEEVAGIAAPTNGLTTIEGPHYPEPHRWYARVEVLDGRVVRVLR